MLSSVLSGAAEELLDHAVEACYAGGRVGLVVRDEVDFDFRHVGVCGDVVTGEEGVDLAACVWVAHVLSSCKAMERPIVMPPISWLRARSGLMTRPIANIPSRRRTRTSPVARSTVTSAKIAL